jgi:hypothetical protein
MPPPPAPPPDARLLNALKLAWMYGFHEGSRAQRAGEAIGLRQRDADVAGVMKGLDRRGGEGERSDTAIKSPAAH